MRRSPTAPDVSVVRPVASRPIATRLLYAPPFALGTLLALVFAVYAPALQHPFQFDDYNVIVDNPAAHSLPAWLASMPGIRPLLKLSYALNASLSMQPPGFRLFNLACHLLNTVFVFALLRRLTPAVPIALAGAALFALHPAQTEAVTYICGRSVALMSLFYLASIAAWLHRRRAVALGLFLLALLTKETAWTLPFALVLIGMARGETLGDAVRRTWPMWMTALIGAAVLMGIADYRTLLAHSLGIRGIGENLLAQIAGQFYLLTQPLLMLRTNIDPAIALDALAAKGAMLALLVLGGIALLRSERWRWAGGALLWFFLHLLPTNSLLPRNDLANDRQLYLALIGPALLLARGLAQAASARVVAPVCAALALLLATATLQRNADYRSEVALWQATAALSPDKSRVWNNLGYALQQAGQRGDVDAARQAYRRALALDPAAVRARINLRLLDADAPGDGTPAVK